MLRAFLAERLGLLRATRAAIIVGRICMAGFIIVSILERIPWLFIIAVFLYIAGEREVAQVELLALLARLREPAIEAKPS